MALLPLTSKASLRFLLRQTLPLLFPHRMYIGRSPCIYRRNRTFHAESVGATYCIIGHSGAARYFGETEDINRKGKGIDGPQYHPNFLLRRVFEIREAGKHVEFVVEQIKADTAGLEIRTPLSM